MGTDGHAPTIMNIDDVAAYLRVGRRLVYTLAQSGVLPGRKVGNQWRFHLKDVEAWLRSNRSQNDPELTPPQSPTKKTGD